MKRITIILFAIGLTAMSSTEVAAMSTSKVRQETRFLTDKMAYELNLNTAQYNDVYEINFDFIYAVRNIMDNVVYGQEWALDEYYNYLDIRNDDLRWVLNNGQYRRFMQIDYFYRPIYADAKGWSFRVYITYSNPRLFYFGIPHNFMTYRGTHYRTHYNNVSYYRGRYHHKVYVNYHSVRDHRVYYDNRRADFGRITIRPNSSRRPVHRDDVYSVHHNNSNSSARRSYSSSQNARESRTSHTDYASERKSHTSDSQVTPFNKRESSSRPVREEKRNSYGEHKTSSSPNRSSEAETRRPSTRIPNRSSSSSSSSSRSSRSSRTTVKEMSTPNNTSSENKRTSDERTTRSASSSRRR